MEQEESRFISSPSSAPSSPSHSPSSLKQKLKSSLHLPSCFNRLPCHHRRRHSREILNSYPDSSATPTNDVNPPPRISRTSSLPRGSHLDIPHLKDKCRNFMSHVGCGPGRHRRRHSSADFRYDASSYALNFDDNEMDEFPLRDFTSRLPQSPTKRISALS